MSYPMKKFDFIFFLLFITTCSYSQDPCLGIPTVIYAGKIYNTVQIGGQCWLKENLDVGTMINGLDTAGNNDIIEKYCYNDDTANCTTYGGLYQWDEAMQYLIIAGTQGICPTSWHIPSYAEYQTLQTAVSNDGNALKAIGQGTGDGAGTNTSGFSALLAGYRNYDGNFYSFSLGFNTFFWSSTEIDAKYANYVSLYNGVSNFYFYYSYKVDGFSVRCLKDASTGINDHLINTLPKSFDLSQNFPNPFNPSTTISFTLPERTNVTLSIYNQLGEKVAVLLNGEKEAGIHSMEWNASKFVSGVYFYELKADKFTSVKKLMLVK